MPVCVNTHEHTHTHTISVWEEGSSQAKGILPPPPSPPRVSGPSNPDTLGGDGGGGGDVCVHVCVCIGMCIHVYKQRVCLCIHVYKQCGNLIVSVSSCDRWRVTHNLIIPPIGGTCQSRKAFSGLLVLPLYT